jgi:hypothetical protein
MLTMALQVLRQPLTHTYSWVKTYDDSKAETMLNVFHSRRRDSMNASQECLNRKREGETEVGVHSSGKGRGKWTVDSGRP